MTAIVFDLDGTLVDSVPDLHAAALATLAEADLPAVSLAQTRSFVGNGAPKLVERLIAAAGGAPERHVTLLDRFLHHYAADPVSRTELYPGVAEALSALTASGHVLAICTNKPEAPARAVAEHFGLSEKMVAIIGGDSLPVKKPDPAPLHAAIAATRTDCVLYVGDSEVDAATAQAAGTPFALFTEGYRKTPIADIPHRYAFARFAELPDIAAQACALA